MFKDLLWEDMELDIPTASLQNLTDIFFSCLSSYTELYLKEIISLDLSRVYWNFVYRKWKPPLRQHA